MDESLPPKLDDGEDNELHLVDPGSKRKSKFWAYYKAYDLDFHPDKQHTARCILCGRDISVKQGTGGLVRHLQHKHADESDDLVAITSSYPAPNSMPRNNDVGAPGTPGDDLFTQPRKKARYINAASTDSVDVVEAKIKREEHNLKMWRDAKDELKSLKVELENAETEEEKEELKSDIEAFKQRKATFAKLLVGFAG
eukprot:scaffold53302_cov69-Cyclotella_meneghiniana.AAC.6